jgi:S1-C subfamily serine protease
VRRDQGKLWRVLPAFALVFLGAAASFPGAAQNTISYEELKKTNVSLEITGFAFASGLNAGANGQPNWNGVEMVQAQWAGSGFIVQPDGTILTNYHVARKALGGRAVFEDGSSFDITQIKAYDPVNDIAVLKLKGQKTFPTVVLGDSDAVNVMDKVLAVGNALGQHMAVTEGMINQVFVNDNNVRYQIRHSATIAPGNSGGALYRGDQVIGINVAGILGYSIYYSIPINVAKPLLDPKYAWVPLAQAFPADLQSIVQKAKQVFTQNGQVPAATKQEPGTQGFSLDVYPLEDLIFVVQSPGKNLALAAVSPADNKTVGLGDLAVPDTEMLIINNENMSKVNVFVMNYDKKPANFALTAYVIQW